MASVHRIAAATLAGTGLMLITVGQVVLESWATNRVHLLVAGVGVVLLSTGGLWLESLRHVEGEYDERQMAIRYRSGWLTCWVLITTILALWIVQLFSSWRGSVGVFAVLGVGGAGLQGVGHVILKRRM